MKFKIKKEGVETHSFTFSPLQLAGKDRADP